MQARGTNPSVDDAAPVSAPLEAAWDSIRNGLRRDLGARTFDGWLKPAELGDFEPDSGTLDLIMFGRRKATRKASDAKFAPTYRACSESRTSARIRLASVSPPTEPSDRARFI